MDGNMAEGISTSLRTCPFLQPREPQRPNASESHLSPMSSHLHVNDLGLTPSPGSQQQQPSDATQASFQDENNDRSGWNHVPRGESVRDESTQYAEDLSHRAESGTQTRNGHGDASSIEGSQWLVHNGNDYSHAGDKAGLLLDRDANQDSFKDMIHSLPDLNDQHNAEQDFLDPLFDADLALQGLETAFESRKRSGDDAFPTGFDIWGPPEKRQFLELPSNQQDSNNTPPGETPSLSSPNSSLRPDPMETAPHSPYEMDRSQTPNSLFDSLDALFEDPGFPASLDMNFDTTGESIGHEELNIDLSSHFSDLQTTPTTATCPDQAAPAFPSVSEATRQRFELNAQDIATSKSSEVFQRVGQEPQYMSPYPQHGGPLGYLPSAPGIHVKCIEVAEDQVNYRMENSRRRIYQLTQERNKYRKAWSQWATLDPNGKTRAQVLQQENSTLRRVSSQHQRRVEEYKAEAEGWRRQLQHVGTLYNNLLYELQQHKIPAIAPAPAGYKPRPGPGTHNAQVQYPAPTQQPAIANTTPQSQPPVIQHGHETNPFPQSATAPQQSNTPASQPRTLQQNPNVRSQAEAITIDLTDESAESAPNPQCPSVPAPGRPELLQSLRNKKYEWLGNQNNSPSHQMHQTSTGGHLISRRDKDHLPGNKSLQPTHSVDADRNTGADIDEEELARAMEDELARG